MRLMQQLCWQQHAKMYMQLPQRARCMHGYKVIASQTCLQIAAASVRMQCVFASQIRACAPSVTVNLLCIHMEARWPCLQAQHCASNSKFGHG